MRMSKTEKCMNVINIVLIVLLCIITLYPYINQLAISLNEGTDAMRGGITIFPRKFTLENFSAVIKNKKIIDAAYISVLRVVLSVSLSLVVTFSAAFALTRPGLGGRKQITWFLCIPGYISAGLIPHYIVYRYYGLINNFWIYVIPGLFSFYNMIIMRSFLQEIPRSIEESALIDGANEVQTLFKIILPLSMPVIATVALWIAVGGWNDWTTTLQFVTKPKLFTLQYVMMQIIKESEVAQKMAADQAVTGRVETVNITSESVRSAVLIVSTFPIIMVYPFLQKYFIKGVTLGAVKE